VRLRNVLFVLGAIAVAIWLLRRRTPAEYVDVHFEDGSTIRLTDEPEARELLDDVYAVFETVA
jgi:cell division septum initiation protein DivIVA